MTAFLGIILIAIIVTVDNALLAGLLLPNTASREKRSILIIVAVLLGLSQILLAASVDKLLHNPLFRYVAITLLAWMCIRTLGMYSVRRTLDWTTVVKLWLFTVFGNLDNMIWLGSKLQGDRLWLTVASFATIPLFVFVAHFLSDQSEKQQWILPLGAGMMAWAAAALMLDIPAIGVVINSLDDAPKTTFQCLITVAILLIGLAIRQIAKARFHIKR